MIILGISAYFHDSAAALLVDGRIVAAAQEERFTRLKHDANLPVNAVEYCLSFQGITMNEVDAVVFYEKPLVKFGRIIDSTMKNIPKGFPTFRSAFKSWLSEKLWIPSKIQKALNYKGPVYFTEHHEAHAASAYYSAPFDEAIVLVIDAVGEKSCTSIHHGRGNELTPIVSQEYPHSLGLFYSAFTYYCGFKVNSGEYKLMGLAPYGTPKYADLIKEHFISIGDKGEVTLTMKNYGFDAGLKMLSNKGVAQLPAPVREPESEMTQVYKDIAASVQQILEEAVVKIVGYGLQEVASQNVAMAGGVALNCVANQKLKEAFPNHRFWVQPAAGDAGGAAGAAQAYYHKTKPKTLFQDVPKNHAYLGPSFSEEQIKTTLDQFGAAYQYVTDNELPAVVAKYLHDEKIVGWFQGRMEFGPRALGNRSILASPIPENMKSRLNLAIKKREGFRPFAPAVIAQEAGNWFEEITESKYMLQTFRSKRKTTIPSCVHEDNTSRVQTVSQEDNPRFYALLDAFHTHTEVPVLINTSFNLRGEPIVCSPEDAINCFLQTEMDVLVLENYIIHKTQNSSLSPSKNVVRILD